MSKRDLVQELREVANKSTERIRCDLLAETVGVRCADHFMCKGRGAAMLNALVDRIESEYEPRPEPDSIEKVAKDVVAWMDDLIEETRNKTVWVTDDAADPFRKRLKALGVTFDDQ